MLEPKEIMLILYNVAERTMEKQENERAMSDGDSHA